MRKRENNKLIFHDNLQNRDCKVLYLKKFNLLMFAKFHEISRNYMTVMPNSESNFT